MPVEVAPWLDQDQPHESERSAAQIDAILSRLADSNARILDLGCGGGRVLVPLVRAGHSVLGIDQDAEALERCRAASAGSGLDLVQADFTASDWPDDLIRQHAPFDAVLLLGNTLMTIWQIDRAVALLAGIASLLKRKGVLVIDDIPHDLWPLVAEGSWITGISDDSESEPLCQFIWAPDDTVFALRRGTEVDTGQWEIRESEPRYRLWTIGALTLAARLAGLSGPDHDAEGGLLILARSNRD